MDDRDQELADTVREKVRQLHLAIAAATGVGLVIEVDVVREDRLGLPTLPHLQVSVARHI